MKDPVVSALNNTYERALVSMHKMPRIWLEYLVNVPTWLQTEAVTQHAVALSMSEFGTAMQCTEQSI